MDTLASVLARYDPPLAAAIIYWIIFRSSRTRTRAGAWPIPRRISSRRTCRTRCDERLPVETWRYKNGLGLNSEEHHIGPYAEDLATLGLSDGVTINPVDVAGLGLAAIKGLAKKVERLENSLGLAEAAADDRRTGLGLREAHGKAGGLGLAAPHVGDRVTLGLAEAA